MKYKIVFILITLLSLHTIECVTWYTNFDLAKGIENSVRDMHRGMRSMHIDLLNLSQQQNLSIRELHLDLMKSLNKQNEILLQIRDELRSKGDKRNAMGNVTKKLSTNKV